MISTRVRKIAATGVIGVLVALAGPTAAHATPGDNRWGLLNLNTHQQNVDAVMAPSSSANAARVVLRTLQLTSSGDFPAIENWQVTRNGVYYRFTNVSTGKRLGVSGGSTDNYVAIIAATPDGSLNQDWYFGTNSNYPSAVRQIKNRKSKKCIGVNGGSVSPGAGLIQAPCDGRANQGWYTVDN